MPITIACDHCGAGFAVQPSHQGKRRYCTPACRQTARLARYRPCETCGTLIPPPPPSREPKGEGKFCSYACAGAGKRVPLEERVWPRLVTEDRERVPGLGPCRVWPGDRSLNGYGRLSEANGEKGRQTLRYVHRIAYELAHGPIPKGGHVLHRCDNPPCCEPAHLFLGDQRSNNEDRDAKGRVRHGERHASAKLTESDVARARTLKATGAISGRALARLFGVGPATMSAALRGDSWKRRP